MDIEKANYDTIIRFGTLDDLKVKLKTQKITIEKIINTIDQSGFSLLENALASRKFDIANYLLDNGIEVNVISKNGFNEFHVLAANINEENALIIAEKLLEKGVSLMQKDRKYGNTAYFTLCLEAFKKRNTEVLKFLEKCFKYINVVDEKNIAGMSIRDLLEQRGTEEQKKLLEANYE